LDIHLCHHKLVTTEKLVKSQIIQQICQIRCSDHLITLSLFFSFWFTVRNRKFKTDYLHLSDAFFLLKSIYYSSHIWTFTFIIRHLKPEEKFTVIVLMKNKSEWKNNVVWAVIQWLICCELFYTFFSFFSDFLGTAE
jgi:hypothetical protein